MSNHQPRPSGSPRPNQLVARLSPDVYESIAKQCQPLVVGTQTTALQIAFAQGQQAVLAILRKDLVV